MPDASPDCLVGRTLIDLLASATPTIGDALGPGLERPSYYTVVMLLDNGEQFEFLGEHIAYWERREALAPVTAETFNIDPSVRFRGQTIAAVSYDECGNLVLSLANQTRRFVIRSQTYSSIWLRLRVDSNALAFDDPCRTRTFQHPFHGHHIWRWPSAT